MAAAPLYLDGAGGQRRERTVSGHRLELNSFVIFVLDALFDFSLFLLLSKKPYVI